MAKRGRKSGAELTALPAPPAALPQRPTAPKALDKQGQKRWRSIVDALPADRWQPTDLVALEDMIRCEQYVRDCDKLITKHGHLMVGATGAYVTNPAVIARRGHLATIAHYQRLLRLAPSTRYDKKAAKLRETTGKRPWESQG